MGLKAKDLKSLSRGDILELLLAQTERVEELEAERTQLKKQLETKDILIGKAGTLAEAALSINQVFQAADRAAAQYLGNIMRLYEEQMECNGTPEPEQTSATEMSPADQKTVARHKAMEQETMAKCETIVQEAAAKCKAIEQETTAKCQAMEQETVAKCQAMEQEAVALCNSLKEEAQAQCAEKKEATELACQDMIEKARKEADAYTQKAYAAMKKYVAEHGELKSLLKTKG